MSDLFNEEQTPETEPQTQEQQTQSTPSIADQLLAGLTNANGEQKYSSIEEAFKGFTAAQNHISKLEQETAELREKANSAKAVEDVLAAIETKGSGTQEQAPAFDIESLDIDSKIQQAIHSKVEADKQESNINTVITKAREAFGDKTAEVMTNKAEELGMSQDAVNSLARKSPAAAIKLLGLDTKSDTTPKVIGINTESFQGTEENLAPKGMYGSKSEQKAEWDYIKKQTANKFGL